MFHVEHTHNKKGQRLLTDLFANLFIKAKVINYLIYV